MKKHILLLAAFMAAAQTSDACTSLLAGKAATADGSTMITYNADSYVLYGELYQTRAADYPAGSTVDVYEWDTRKYLGKIEQVRHVYATVGNVNEHQLAISESTWDCRPELMDTTGIIDYGSLIYLTLQRAKTAREAISVMTGLVEKYGYYSGGESFSIADPNEVWIMEMSPKGAGNKGAVWAAIRIPDDCISAHANQSRIHRIPFGDKDNCLYSEDVVEFARSKGYFSGKDSEFSFSDAYAVSDYLSYRGCDGRVWSFYNRFATGMDRYLPFVVEAKGEPLPLYVKPSRKVGLGDFRDMLRDHYDGTPLDMTKEPGAGPWDSPYRCSPLVWKADSTEYIHERPIATQQTGFVFIAQLRSWLPDPIGGILWFGTDDSAMNVLNPIYCGVTRVPECYREGNGDLYTFSWTSSFWVNNWVANQVYVRYSQMYPDVRKVQSELEGSYAESTRRIEEAALRTYRENPEAALDMLTEFSDSVSEHATGRYRKLGEYLTVKYLDFRIKKEDASGNFLRSKEGYPESPEAPGYSDSYYRDTAAKGREHLRVRKVAR